MMDDYDLDGEYAGFDDMEYDYGPPPMPTRNDRYNNAFGNYRGGYGPGGDYGPPRFGPRFSAPGPGPMWGRGYGPGGPGGPGQGYGPRGPGQGYPPRGPGHGYPPRGPPRHLPKMEIEKAYRYLIRCGVPKESLKNVPNDFYNMVSPQHCGLCGMDLPDFNLSRVHYSSKNHMKSQKKWLSKRIENTQRAKEAPLKSRDLYCELCDVQITSKSHAESHYLGKPHRAIVEGRKAPKNPILLQRNMNARLEQLVRREKKALKNAEEKKPAAETQKEEETKIDPELHCEICKTSVTCSEQMTMHLNGKKHLAKEKRHIFDMMKGNAEEQAGEETYQDDDKGDEQQNEASGEGDTVPTEQNEEPWTEEWNENNGSAE